MICDRLLNVYLHAPTNTHGKLLKHIFQKLRPIGHKTRAFIFYLLSTDPTLTEIPNQSVVISPCKQFSYVP
jgi:hypothetical protein